MISQIVNNNYYYVIHDIVVQIRFQVISTCDQWIHINNTDKLIDFTTELMNFIRMECGCAFPLAHFYLPKFMCFPGSSHHVTFRSAIIKYSNWTASMITTSIEHWITLTDTITFQQETVVIDKGCPSLILTFEDSECLSNAATQLFPVIGGISAGLSCILIILVIVAIITCTRIKFKRYNSYYDMKSQGCLA